ncbi:Serine/threonine-protein phosphatase PP1-alpha, partial [Diplonema papillatum]
MPAGTKHVNLAGADCGGNEADHVARNALSDNESVFVSKGAAAEWKATVKGQNTNPVCLIVCHGGGDKDDFTGIGAELLDSAGKAVWTSPVLIATGHDQVSIHVPNVKATRVRLRKTEPYGKGTLRLRYVEVFVSDEPRYTLSKVILTIDQFAVAQPFTFSQLQDSTAYDNLCTTSAFCNLSQQDSISEEKEHEALNLTHHLIGIWDGTKQKFEHGKYVDTVRVVLIAMLESAKQIFLQEKKMVDVPAPCYVFGDIHGNFNDLHYFMSNLIPFKHIKFSSHNYLFLGDYVDRGLYDVECLAYLMALKVQAPKKTFLVRGNHEERAQNSKLDESFLKHCCTLFGKEEGMEVWKLANDVFDVMPVCAVVDNRLFCCHGGVPRVPKGPDGVQMPIRAAMEKLPQCIERINDSDDPYMQMVCDLLWGDPAQDDCKDVEDFAW